MERSCGPPSLQEMPATLAELWNRALMRRANTDSPSAASASNNGTDDAVDETQLQAEVAALLTEEGEGAVLSELLGEIPAGFGIDPAGRETAYSPAMVTSGKVHATKKKRRRGSPREHHQASSDASCTSTTSEASDASSSSVMTMLYPSLF
eukprot:Transcript_3374.p3 GENE.Transcript_3374~~Transcript_3374.p3  ORF type:complete len:151 (-),score=8.46 Transcript_3374:216-668(-)